MRCAFVIVIAKKMCYNYKKNKSDEYKYKKGSLHTG